MIGEREGEGRGGGETTKKNQNGIYLPFSSPRRNMLIRYLIQEKLIKSLRRRKRRRRMES